MMRNKTFTFRKLQLADSYVCLKAFRYIKATFQTLVMPSQHVASSYKLDDFVSQPKSTV